jgi:membrane-associated phospholipid phosphatase
VTGEVRLRAPAHARTVGVLTYGAALATAYARMHDDRHWLSDVTVGAGIGTVTGWAITRWHETRPENPIDRVLLRPVIAPAPLGGMRVGLSMQSR